MVMQEEYQIFQQLQALEREMANSANAMEDEADDDY
jgi:hypothetical protein